MTPEQMAEMMKNAIGGVPTDSQSENVEPTIEEVD